MKMKELIRRILYELEEYGFFLKRTEEKDKLKVLIGCVLYNREYLYEIVFDKKDYVCWILPKQNSINEDLVFLKNFLGEFFEVRLQDEDEKLIFFKIGGQDGFY